MKCIRATNLNWSFVQYLLLLILFQKFYFGKTLPKRKSMTFHSNGRKFTIVSLCISGHILVPFGCYHISTCILFSRKSRSC